MLNRQVRGDLVVVLGRVAPFFHDGHHEKLRFRDRLLRLIDEPLLDGGPLARVCGPRRCAQRLDVEALDAQLPPTSSASALR
jgi:hypothetical protein